jgi:hypothetical protein
MHAQASTMKTASVLKPILLLVAVVIGAWEGFISLQTIFVMKNESLLLMALIIGPLSIIPAAAVSMWRSQLAGRWLIGAGIAFFAITSLHRGIEIGQIKTALFLFSLPMILLGVGFIWVAKVESHSNVSSTDL